MLLGCGRALATSSIPAGNEKCWSVVANEW